MKYFAEADGERYECLIEARNGETFVVVNGTRYRADLRRVPGSASTTLLLDGRSYEFAVLRHDEGIELSGAAGQFLVKVEDERTRAARDRAPAAAGPRGPRILKSVMPGIVREVLVKPGDAVTRGQPMLILEAMKMQNEIRADQDALVKSLRVEPGTAVEKGAPLVELE
ncbi:MAG: biotin/lipoyl-containing protein [Planctomycetaceae bacterium]